MLNFSDYKGISIVQGNCGTSGGEAEVRVFLYVVDGLLIDSGPQSLAEDTKNYFSSKHIDQVALTHNHEDHSGMAPWLQNNLNVPIYLHPGSIPDAHLVPEYLPYRQEMWGYRYAFEPTTMPEVIKTPLYTFEAIDSPGHCPYHNVFYERNQGWLFTGDLYLGTKLYVCFEDDNMKQTIATLEKLLELDFDTVFCAHAGVIENGKIRMQKKLDFLKNLQNQVNGFRKQGISDEDIDKEIYGFEMPLTELSKGEWSSYNIIHTI